MVEIDISSWHQLSSAQLGAPPLHVSAIFFAYAWSGLVGRCENVATRPGMRPDTAVRHNCCGAGFNRMVYLHPVLSPMISLSACYASLYGSGYSVLLPQPRHLAVVDRKWSLQLNDTRRCMRETECDASEPRWKPAVECFVLQARSSRCWSTRLRLALDNRCAHGGR